MVFSIDMCPSSMCTVCHPIQSIIIIVVVVNMLQLIQMVLYKRSLCRLHSRPRFLTMRMTCKQMALVLPEVHFAQRVTFFIAVRNRKCDFVFLNVLHFLSEFQHLKTLTSKTMLKESLF